MTPDLQTYIVEVDPQPVEVEVEALSPETALQIAKSSHVRSLDTLQCDAELVECLDEP